MRNQSWRRFSAIFDQGEISDSVISSVMLDAQDQGDSEGIALATALISLRTRDRRALLEVDTTEKFTVSDNLYIALEAIKDKWDCLMSSRPSPFENNSSSFSCDIFSVQAYSWNDGDQAYNFKWRDIEVHWYKYFGRAMWVSRSVLPEEAVSLSAECIRVLEDGVITGAFLAGE